jgi:hypothetical protein
MAYSSKQAFYLEFLTTDPMRFIPVQFSEVNGAISEPNTGDSFAFAPATPSIDSSQSGNFTDSGRCGERLDLKNSADNFEMHRK